MKKVLIAVIAVVLVIALTVCIVPASFKMKLLADYSFKQIRDFNYQKFVENDPLTEELTKLFGEDKPESVSAMYSAFQELAAQMEWEVTATDPAACTATVTTDVVDASPFIGEYASRMSDVLASSIFNGTLQINSLNDLFGAVTDEENAAMIRESFSGAEFTDRLSVPVTLLFEKKAAGIMYMPSGFGEGMEDAITAGIYSNIDTILPTVAENVIKSLVVNFFDVIQSGDMESIQKLIGSDLNLGTIKDSYPKTYDALIGFLHDRAAEVSYKVTGYDLENYTFAVTCEYTDASALVKAYIGSILNYSLTHLFSNPIPTDEDLAAMFRQNAESMEFQSVSRDCRIVFNTETGGVNADINMFNVVTANLFSKFTDLADYLK